MLIMSALYQILKNESPTWHVSYKKQGLLNLSKHLGSPQFFAGVRIVHLSSLFVFILGLVYPARIVNSGVIDCCLAQNWKFFNYIMVRINCI
jgi:hypothetical protein